MDLLGRRAEGQNITPNTHQCPPGSWGPRPHAIVVSHRSLKSSCWTLTGPSMPATGCGCQAVPSSTDISTSTHLLPLARRQTGTEHTFGRRKTQSHVKWEVASLMALTPCCRKYLPVLKDFPAKYIYEPWKAPRAVQEQAGCLVGTHYPQPIVEHGAASKRNLGRMKAARTQKGNESPRRHQAPLAPCRHSSCLPLLQAPSGKKQLASQWLNHKGKSPRPSNTDPHREPQLWVRHYLSGFDPFCSTASH